MLLNPFLRMSKRILETLLASCSVPAYYVTLASTTSTTMRPFRPFLESKPLHLRAGFPRFLCSITLCEKFFRSSEAERICSPIRCKVPPLSNHRITEEESSLVICGDIVTCRRVTTPSPQRGLTGTICLFYVLLHRVWRAVYLGCWSARRYPVLFEGSSSWDLANVVGGR